MRYTECRLAPLAMEMLRDINEDTVDFRPNYDGRSAEPVVLPARFPNLLINGSQGIAVGMATNIPPHNLREVAAGVQWYLDNFERFEIPAPGAAGGDGGIRGAAAARWPPRLLDGLMERVLGPDFPTRGLIVGRRGIREAYRTGRGSITMRAVVEHEEIHGRQLPGRQGTPVPGQPGQPGHEDRRARQGRAADRHRRHRATRRAAGPGSGS